MESIVPRINFEQELGSLFHVKNKVAFVPGGAGGIGEAICWGLAIAGADVVISARDGEKAQKLAEHIRAAKFKATGVALEVKSVGSIQDVADSIVKNHGSLDILVNCVGINIEQPLLEVTEEAYDEVYAVNLKAAMFLGQACARRQIPRKCGKQIHILSVRSQLGLRGRGYSAYCSTKGGLALLIKQHAMELAPYNINVNGVAPTFVHTDMVKGMLAQDSFKQGLLSRIPLGRIADPKDIVGPTLFFASPASNFITGQILFADGGITASQ